MAHNALSNHTRRFVSLLWQLHGNIGGVFAVFLLAGHLQINLRQRFDREVAGFHGSVHRCRNERLYLVFNFFSDIHNSLQNSMNS
ncbi:hypothetical protein SDC9_206888 [bioreactor metagenome]|uniref:Uncharacterized protein n=1 Tax=bioreactor metagenome TaxID=1076179 RepID=A0A645J690_9ZZZZ